PARREQARPGERPDSQLFPRQTARWHRSRCRHGLAPRQGVVRRGPDPDAARRQAADLLGRPGRPRPSTRRTHRCHFESLETMSYQQIAISKFGSASTLKVSDLTPRAPADDEVAIDVAYSGVNFADIQMRLGFYPDAPKKPFVPGYEVSGTVSAVGKGVRDVKPGDAVVAGTYFGGYQSHVTIPARQVFKLPQSVDLAAGAALPVNYFTAQLALFEMARVRK